MLVYGHLDTRQLNQQKFDKNTIVSFQTDTFKNDTGQILPTLSGRNMLQKHDKFEVNPGTSTYKSKYQMIRFLIHALVTVSLC